MGYFPKATQQTSSKARAIPAALPTTSGVYLVVCVIRTSPHQSNETHSLLPRGTYGREQECRNGPFSAPSSWCPPASQARVHFPVPTSAFTVTCPPCPQPLVRPGSAGSETAPQEDMRESLSATPSSLSTQNRRKAAAYLPKRMRALGFYLCRNLT